MRSTAALFVSSRRSMRSNSIFFVQLIEFLDICISGMTSYNDVETQSDATLGLKEILDTPASGNRLLGTQCYDALDIVVATAASEDFVRVVTGAWTYNRMQYRDTLPMEESLWKIVKKYGEKIHLLESDKRRKTSKKKGKRRNSSFAVCREKQIYDSTDWQGPPPWDSLVGGDGCPKFLCDVMVCLKLS